MQSEVDSSGLHSERGCKNELSPEVKPFLRIIELADFWRWAKRDQENSKLTQTPDGFTEFENGLFF